MKTRTALTILALGALPLVGQAAGNAVPDMSHAIDPGLWETTVNMQVTGMPMKITGQSVKHCITQADLDKNHGFPQMQNNKDMSCTRTKFDVNGNVLTYTMKCTGKQGDMTMNGTATMDSRDAYHGTSTMTGTMAGHAMEMTSDYTSKRIGDCTAASSSSSGG